MVRSLWTAATGMVAQQTNVDVIANNLANVNTVGYKTQSNQFKSLLYQSLQTNTTSANGDAKPTSAQVGLGVRNAAITSVFSEGNITESASATSFAIDGDGFFAIKGEDGNTYYTRNGNFTWALNSKGGVTLTTSDGLPVLDSAGKTIEFDKDRVASKITVTDKGVFCYPDAKNNAQPLGITMGLYQFSNPGGLEKKSDSLYRQTAASGAALNESTNTALKKSTILQGYIEGSNVQVVDEMVNLIVAQRAYEMNSKAITASDEMMQQANNLRR